MMFRECDAMSLSQAFGKLEHWSLDYDELVVSYVETRKKYLKNKTLINW